MHPDVAIDITDALIAVIAHALYERCGGNDVLNWIEAEGMLETILKEGAANANSRPKKQSHHGRRERSGRRSSRLPASGSQLERTRMPQVFITGAAAIRQSLANERTARG